jgi:hypothetical protein
LGGGAKEAGESGDDCQGLGEVHELSSLVVVINLSASDCCRP